MKFLKIVGKIFAVILCIGYFFVLTALMTVSYATNLLSGDYYAAMLSDIDLNEIEVADLGNILGDVSEEVEVDEDTTLQDLLVQYLIKGGAKKDAATAIVEDKEIKSIVGKFIGDVVNYNLTKKEPSITRDEVKTVLTNQNVVAVIGQEPTDKDIDRIYDELKELCKNIVENGGMVYGNSNGNNEVNIIH